MAVESIFIGATIRDRFVAAVGRDDEAVTQRLTSLADAPEELAAQLLDAWHLLSAGVRWSARALDSAAVAGTIDAPITDSESAFQRAQHLEAQLWQLSQQPGFHDAVAQLVDSVKRACYRGADLGPVQGGYLASFRHPDGGSDVVATVSPSATDLQDIGSDLGDALRRLGAMGLADVVTEASGALVVDG